MDDAAQHSDGARQEDGSPGADPLGGFALWRLIGPHRAGRVVAVAGDPREPLTFYFGACAGGLWKTTDAGVSWRNVSDGYFRTAAVGAVAVAASDPNVVYVGMGESCIRSDVAHGDGVYRSTDAGKTWRHLGLADTRYIAKVRVHPTDPDLVYVAALGHAYGPNPERGVYRSRDGGATWERVLFRHEDTGAIDLAFDPQNPRVMYAALWQVRRTPYSLTSGGPGSGLFKSVDGGDTWTELTAAPGLPTGVKGKIGVAVSGAQADRVWALVEAEDGALFRSDDGGASWQRLSADGELRRRAWYYTHIYADPINADTVWVLNLQCWKSVDGGKTFDAIPTPHGDNHDMWIDPQRPARMIEGNDGGACVTFDGGASWSTVLNQPTAQFYHVTTDSQFPYRVYGSQQDNTALTVPSRSIRGAITHLDWYDPGGGESGYIAVRPDNPNIVYGGAIGSGAGHGRLIRYDHATGQKRNITVWPDVLGMGSAAKDLKYRFQWTFPITLSPHDPNVLYVAANQLLRSTDEGTSWEEISPDLTRNDASKLQVSGGPITRDNTGAEIYCTIFAFVESPLQRGLFWAGTDDGLIHLSRDGGATWQDVTPPQLPEWALVSVIEASPHAAGAAYVAATRYKWDDPRPFLFKTDDYGAHWQEITTGIPAMEFTRVIREDPARPGLLYAGTELGVWVSLDGGERWRPLQGNLPVAPVYDLTIKDDDLIVATHGRSFWILDDVTPLRQLDGQAPDGEVRLFAPRPTYRFKVYERAGKPAPGQQLRYRYAGPLPIQYRQERDPDGETRNVLIDSGENPPDGVIVQYYLRDPARTPIRIAILDGDGNEIRTFASKPPPKPAEAAGGEAPETTGTEGLEPPAEEPPADEKEPQPPANAGVNRFVWNLRYPDAHAVPSDKSTENLLHGPVALPGRYRVRLTVAGESQEHPFELLQDPRIKSAPDGLAAQFALLLKIRDKLSQAHDAIVELRDLQGQLDAWQRRARRINGGEHIATAAKQLQAKLGEIETALIERQADSPLAFPTRLNARLATLATFVDSADDAPTQGADAVFDQLATQIDAELARYRTALDTELAALNGLIRESGIAAVAAPVKPA